MYTPKTNGETYLRFLTANKRTQARKMHEAGKKFEEPIVCIPLHKAEEIVEMFEGRKDKLETVVKLLEEIKFRLDGEHEIEDIDGMKILVSRALKNAIDSRDLR